MARRMWIATLAALAMTALGLGPAPGGALPEALAAEQGHGDAFDLDQGDWTVLTDLIQSGTARSASGAGDPPPDTLGWTDPSDAGRDSTLAEVEQPNGCEGVTHIYGGFDPSWVRVGGDPSPDVPFRILDGQVLRDAAAARLGSPPEYPKVTHADLPTQHFSLDFNVFLTPDRVSRLHLGTGNFRTGLPEELGRIEVEWERGAVPTFAWPTIGDRMRVWGPLIWDCGHGGNIGRRDEYRTEIHPPVGWVVYRDLADLDDRCPSGACPSRTDDPWVWYKASDLPGSGHLFGGPGAPPVPVRATVADAFFSSFGGEAVASLNGCRDDYFPGDPDPIPSDNAPCSGDPAWQTFRQNLLQQDYSFFIPAPPKPSPDATLMLAIQDRCGSVPSSPGNPPGDDIDAQGEADGSGVIQEPAADLGPPTCSIPMETIQLTMNQQLGVLVKVKAKSGGVTYPANDYVAFAKRFVLGWNHVPPDDERVHRYRVDFHELRVYHDAEPCGEDGEWVMSLRVNDRWIHPVRGAGAEPLWDQGAIDDARCAGESATYKAYPIDESVTVDVPAGRPVIVWERSIDVDATSFTNDVNPMVEGVHTRPGTYVRGLANTDFSGAHTIRYTITDITPAMPDAPDLRFAAREAGSVTIRNEGLTASRDTALELWGSAPIPLPALAPGESVTRSFACRNIPRSARIDPANRVIEVDEEDNVGPIPTCLGADLVDPLSPTTDAGGPYVAEEGSPVTLDATASFDPEGEDLTYAWDLDDDGLFDDATGPIVQHAYGDDGVFRVAMRATDPGMLSETAEATVTVTNVDPTAAIDEAASTALPGGPARVVSVGTPVELSARATDPGTDDLELAWDLGDGTGPTRTSPHDPAVGTDPDPSPEGEPRDVSDVASRAFDAPCAYAPSFSVADDDEGAVSDTAIIIVTGSAAAPRKEAYWHERYRGDGSGLSTAMLRCYAAIVAAASSVFGEARALETIEDAHAVWHGHPSADPHLELLDRELLAAWLNLANGAFGDGTALVDTDGDGTTDTSFVEVLTRAEEVRLDPASTTDDLKTQEKALRRINGG